MAQVSFVDIFKSTTNNQQEESSSFTGAKLAGATNIRFVSQDPAAVTFSGNNVPGNLYFTLNGVATTIPGIVSRNFKTGSTYEGFYFVDSGTDYTLGSQETTFAYLLVVPSQASAFPSSPGTYGTSSDPVDAALNALLASQPTLLGITQNDADLALLTGQTVLYTFEFSTDMDAATFTAADLQNTGTAGITFGAITEVSPGKFTVAVTATSTGTIRLAIQQNAVITTPTGLGFNTATQTLDDQTLTVTAPPAPTVSAVTAEDAAKAAGSGDTIVDEGQSLRYAITLSGATSSPTEYTLAASGTAAAADYSAFTFSNGVTYNASTGKITVPAGVSSFTITAPTVDDTAVEPSETLTLTVGGVAGAGTITDNDVPPAAPTIGSVTAEDAATAAGSNDSSVVEGNSLRYAVALTSAPSSPTEFTLATSGTASAADYSAFTFSNGVTYNAATGKITVPAGVSSFTITAPTVDDTAVEPSETLTLTVGGVAGTGTITDNDVPPAAPTIGSVTAEDPASPAGSGDSSVVEGSPLRYTVALTAATSSPTDFTLAASGTAAAADYTAFTFSDGVTYNAATGKITVPAGVSSFTITAPTVDDTAVEPSETLTLTIGGVAGTGTITDNDSVGVSAVTAEDASTAPGSGDSAVVEGNPLRYTVALNATTVAPTELSLATSGSAVAADYGSYVFSDGVTYNATTGKVTIPAGVSSFTITVPTVDDTGVELPETLTLTVGGVAGTGTITDNDNVGVSVVTAEDASTAPGSGDSSVVEGNPLRYSVALNATTVAPTELSLATSGSAVAADYGSYVFSDGVTYNATTGKVTIPAGVSSFTITVPTVDDTGVELPETLTLTVGGVAGAGTITDNDVPGISAISAEDAATPAGSGDSSVVEGSPLRFTVELTTATVAATEYPLAASGTAAAADYGNFRFSNGVTYDPATGKITVPAGVSSFTITAPTVDDTAVEPAETLTLTVGGVASTGTITDNDVPGISAVTAEDAATQPGSGDSSVVEGNPLRYTVALTTAAVAPTEFTLAASGTTSAADYSAFTFSNGVTYNPTTGKITVPAGVASFTITAPTVDDTAVEPAETLTLTVGGVASTGTITDNDVPAISAVTAQDPAAAAGANDPSVVEGNSLRYTVGLTAATVAPTEFTLATSGTASAADYGSLSFSNGVTYNPATGKITVPAGVSSFTVTVPTIDDTSVEATEALTLTVGGVAGSGAIIDNDAPGISAVTAEDAASLPGSGDSTVVEGNPLRYTVGLTTATNKATEYTLAAGGTASPTDYGTLNFSNGVTYSVASGKITVPAGVSSFTITAPTVDDTSVEATEALVLAIEGVASNGIILDNDINPILDPASDTGARDNITRDVNPVFTIGGGSVLTPGGSARLLDASGNVVGTAPVTAADVAAGKVQVPSGQLDDGVYTYTAQILDAQGNVVASGPVTVTIVTDLDGVMPSVELAGNGGDFNRDGVQDWQQNNVAQLPVTSLEAYQAGKNAPAGSFGAVLIGRPDATSPGTVKLDGGAQLLNVSVQALPSLALPSGTKAVTPLYDFTVTNQTGLVLQDINPTRAGVQTQAVIDLPAGVAANAFMKFNGNAQTWANITNAAALNGSVDGAAIIDANGDGKIDRIVLTLTDGAAGDADGLVNGFIVDPGLLAIVAPFINGPSGNAGAAASGKTIPEGTKPVAAFTANEPVTWAVAGGVDQAMFSIDASGQLVFKAPPDFEAPKDADGNNTYIVQIEATNSLGAKSIQTVTVTIKDVGAPVYYSVLPNGDRTLSTTPKAGESGNVQFYAADPGTPNTIALKAWYNPLTGDWFYGRADAAAPYECYEERPEVVLGRVLDKGQGAFDVRTYVNSAGVTQVMSKETAMQLGLESQGFRDLGDAYAFASADAIPVGLVGVPPGSGPVDGGP